MPGEISGEGFQLDRDLNPADLDGALVTVNNKAEIATKLTPQGMDWGNCGHLPPRSPQRRQLQSGPNSPAPRGHNDKRLDIRQPPMAKDNGNSGILQGQNHLSNNVRLQLREGHGVRPPRPGGRELPHHARQCPFHARRLENPRRAGLSYVSWPPKTGSRSAPSCSRRPPTTSSMTTLSRTQTSWESEA